MTSTKLTAYIFLAIPILLIVLKVAVWDYTFERILPKKKYEVNLNITAEGFDEGMKITTYLPLSNHRQNVSNELSTSPSFAFDMQTSSNGRQGQWKTDYVKGKVDINYSFDFIGQGLSVVIDPEILIANDLPASFQKFLEPSKEIQSTHPYIKNIADTLVGEESYMLNALNAIHGYAHALAKRPFKGVTDALTAARLQEASCNGKSRLFVALARAKGIPARLVGGVILNTGSKKTSHQWVEVYINRTWVPFDPLNNHFASIPHNYLELYKGDQYLFSHTSGINFDYQFATKARLSPNPSLIGELQAHVFNAYELWRAFEKIGVPIGLLKIILLLPLGALIVAIFRNVIGLKTFGVFLPALIAIASRETGLVWGLVAFMIVMLVVSLVHFPLEKWGVLYTPKLVIMLVCVVMLFMFVSYAAIQLNVLSLAYITLFPIVVLAVSAEKFARTIAEDGYRDALIISVQTLIVASVAYFAMNSTSIEAFFLAFPEMFLMIIGFNLLLGKWVGLRAAEYARFKYFIQ